jgi:hypothetical protein
MNKKFGCNYYLLFALYIVMPHIIMPQALLGKKEGSFANRLNNAENQFWYYKSNLKDSLANKKASFQAWVSKAAAFKPFSKAKEKAQQTKQKLIKKGGALVAEAAISWMDEQSRQLKAEREKRLASRREEERKQQEELFNDLFGKSVQVKKNQIQVIEKEKELQKQQGRALSVQREFNKRDEKFKRHSSPNSKEFLRKTLEELE